LADFPAVTQAEWRQSVEAELKGVPFEKKLVTKTYEGIDLQPLYAAEAAVGLDHLGSFPGFAPFVRGGSAAGYLSRPWDISQELTEAGLAEFNTAARASLDRGLTALNLVLDRATRNGADPDTAPAGDVGRGGLSIANLAELDRALAGVDLSKVSLLVRSGASALPFASLLTALARQRGVAPSQLRGCIEMDPLGVLAHEGCLPQSLANAYDEMAMLTRWAAGAAPGVQTVCVHSRSWHDGGGSAVQELAFGLATALDYLRELERRGLSVDLAASRLRLALTVGSQFFMEIAKVRAARLVWWRLIQVLGGGSEAQRLTLHVRTSLWNKTIYDPHVNLLRATVEAFAAAVGGVDSLQVGAFDEAARLPDDFSRRLARNTQLILQKECYLDHVIDPAGGSWYVETLTRQLADKTWSLVQEVERRGGMAQAMREGFPQQCVAATAREKLTNLARRRDVMIGINQYANLQETVLPSRPPYDEGFQRRRALQVAEARTAGDTLAHGEVMSRLARVVDPREPERFEACVEAFRVGASLGEVTRALRASDSAEPSITPVCLTRAAADFERLRLAMDQHVAAGGRRPEVFLVNLGPPSQHRARADFSRAFFALGGFGVISPNGFPNVAAALEAATASQARVAVICSTDETYPELVPPLAQGLKQRIPGLIVVLAGYPADQVAAYRQAGVDDFIHLRANALEVLQQLQQRVGVSYATIS
jgi:methylmalonyl-CoA mutase